MRDKEENRLIGLELLRIVAMLCVLTYHFVCTGRFVESNNFSIFIQSNVIKYLVIVAVNCYVLITAYFMSEKNFKLLRIANIYKLTWFYSAVCFFALLFINKDSFSISSMLKSFLPFTFNEYWFVNKYILMLLLSPILNRALTNARKSTMKLYLLVTVGVFCIYNSIMYFINPLDTSNGFGISWFLIIYIVGAYIKKYYSPNMKFVKFLLLYILCFLANFSLFLVSKKLGCSWLSSLVSNYNSFFVFLQSVFLFLTFLNINVSNKKIRNVIYTIAPLTFAVYLIHESTGFKSFIWSVINVDTFFVADVLFVPALITLVLMMFFVCIFIEFCRAKVFNILKIDSLIAGLSTRIECTIRKLVNK